MPAHILLAEEKPFEPTTFAASVAADLCGPRPPAQRLPPKHRPTRNEFQMRGSSDHTTQPMHNARLVCVGHYALAGVIGSLQIARGVKSC